MRDKDEWKCVRTSRPPENTLFLARGKGIKEVTLIMRGGKVYHAPTGLPMIFITIEEWRLK